MNELKSELNSLADVELDDNPFDMLNDAKSALVLCEESINELDEEIKAQEAKNEKVLDFLNKNPQSNVQGEITRLEGLEKENKKNVRSLDSTKQKIIYSNEEAKILCDVPCNNSFPSCKFIKKANQCEDELPALIEESERLESLIVYGIDKELKNLRERLLNLKNLKQKRSSLQLSIINLSQKKKDAESSKQAWQDKIEDWESKIELEKQYVKRLFVNQQYEDCKEEQKNIDAQIKLTEEDLTSNAIKKGVLEQKEKNVSEKIQEHLEIRKKINVYELFQKCMHSNGIAFSIIKQQIPLINDELSKILTSIVGFDIFFETDGKKLSIFIKHPNQKPRPVEMCSGAEKTIASMAIRLALTEISTLPKSNIFILDEPGTSLDADNMHSFTQLLDIIKQYYDKIILISHLDFLKDYADYNIMINEVEGGARILEY